MKSRITIGLFVAIAALASGLSLPYAIDAQDLYLDFEGDRWGRGRGGRGMTVRPQPILEQLRQATEAIRDAEDEEAKADVIARLTSALNEYFDEDMARRQEELAKLEERLQRLRAQLETRRTKKREIIALQIQLIENEAAGLGLFGRPGGIPALRDAYLMDTPQPRYGTPQPAAPTSATPADRPMQPPQPADPAPTR